MATEYNSRVHPKKFALWTGCGSITMMFAGLTSAYMVRRAQGDWVAYKFPEMFNYSTIVVVLSSIVLVLSYLAYRKQKIGAYRIGLSITLILGCLFGFLQYLGWQEMTNMGVELTGNPSGSFVYLISGIHLAHIAGGLIFMLAMLIKSFFKKDPVKDLLDSTINPERFLGIELISTYWHFVGILWIYLFIFFQYYR